MIIQTCTLQCDVCWRKVDAILRNGKPLPVIPNAGWYRYAWEPGVLNRPDNYRDTNRPDTHICSDACKEVYLKIEADKEEQEWEKYRKENP